MESKVWRPALLTVILLAGMTLSGCLGSDDAAPQTTAGGTDTGTGNTTGNLTSGARQSVEGFVLDPARAPLAGATVRLQNHDREATTDERGHYDFGGLIDNQLYVLIAEAEGHKPKAQQVVAIEDKVVRLDFVLDERPTETPWDEVIERAGFISCQAFAGAGHDHGGDGKEFEQRCAGALGDDPNAVQVLELETKATVAGIVVEVQWESNQPLADFLMVTVESVGFGDLDKQFGQVISSSVIKIEIPQDDVAKYYKGQGGIVRVSVDAHYEDDDEQAAGAAFGFQQAFLVRMSNFYVEPQPRSYTAFPDGEAGDP